jgi:predicted acyl esterase
VPHGYAIVRIDSRGAGWSPGFMDPASPRETEDLYQCIERAGTQPWSNGKVGMLGISSYASNQWRVAAMNPPPPHLVATIPWEGQNDRYRDSGYHGGILCEFQKRWAKHPVVMIQYGRGDKARTPTPANRSLSDKPVRQTGHLTYDALGKGVTFMMPPLEKETEVTGLMKAKLLLSSTTSDTDLFVICACSTRRVRCSPSWAAATPTRPSSTASCVLASCARSSPLNRATLRASQAFVATLINYLKSNTCVT